METKSEKFEKAFAETWAEWVEKGRPARGRSVFLPKSLTVLKKLGPSIMGSG
jgi:hypothetical protein